VGFKELCPGILQNFVQDAKCPRFSQIIKYVSDNAYEYFDFPTVGETICGSWIAINYYRKGIGEGDEDV
jgi:hypothetical protein